MIHRNLKTLRVTMFMAALGAALFVSGRQIRAADDTFPIYFADSKLVVNVEAINGTIYLPVVEIAGFLGLPYTDAFALETLTVRGRNGNLVGSRNSALLSIDDQIVLLSNPILREDGRWLVPVEFLNLGLSRITGTEFRHRSGTGRIFAGNVQVPELLMNAQVLGSITRLTLRGGAPMNLELQRDEQNNRAILRIDRVPLDPLRERLDHRDSLVDSIAFDDSDGQPKILMGITNEAGDIKITAADGNRVFFVDVLRKSDSVTLTPPPVEEPASTIDPLDQRVRVVVIDPGHGGMDLGIRSGTIVEKDLTLVLARKLRAALRTQLGATVILTRDSDIALDNQARAEVANNNQADVFISLHIGNSANTLDSGSSVFVMADGFGATSIGNVGGRRPLFLPWYLGYKNSQPVSLQIAQFLQEDMSNAVAGWSFPIRTAPLGVLASATMPALVVEIGNVSNSTDAQALMEPRFQDRIVAAIVNTIRRFSEIPRRASTN